MSWYTVSTVSHLEIQKTTTRSDQGEQWINGIFGINLSIKKKHTRNSTQGVSPIVVTSKIFSLCQYVYHQSEKVDVRPQNVFVKTWSLNDVFLSQLPEWEFCLPCSLQALPPSHKLLKKRLGIIWFSYSEKAATNGRKEGGIEGHTDIIIVVGMKDNSQSSDSKWSSLLFFISTMWDYIESTKKEWWKPVLSNQSAILYKGKKSKNQTDRSLPLVSASHHLEPFLPMWM